MERSSPDLDDSTASTEDEQMPMQHTPEQDPASEHGSLISSHPDSSIDEESASSACPDNNVEEEKKKKTTNKRSSWSLLWQVELWTWFGSVCCFIAIIAVLAILNNKESPNWYFEITPNAVIQLLATFSQALLMASVSAGMGQKKWLRMLRVRPMIDFQRLDQSSRGPWGSLVLLISLRGGMVSSLGALITILSLGIATSFQQTLRYHTVYSTGDDASVAVARYLNGSSTVIISYDPVSFMGGFDPELTSAPYVALFSPPRTEFISKAHCGAGNCTWESYETLAVCNTCKDLSSSLRRTGNDDIYFYMLQNGFGISPYLKFQSDLDMTAVLNVTATVNVRDHNDLRDMYWGSVAFSNNGSQLLNVFAVGYDYYHSHIPDSGVSALPVAYECLLQYCIREMRATWTNNTFTETVVSTRTDESFSTWKKEVRGSPYLTWPSPFVFTSPRTGTTFYISTHALQTTNYWLSQFVNGNASVSKTSNRSAYFSSEFTGAVWRAIDSSPTGFPDLMDNLANRLSLSASEKSHTSLSPWASLQQPRTSPSSGGGGLLFRLLSSSPVFSFSSSS